MEPVSLGMVVALSGLLTFIAIFAEVLRKFLDIQVTSWTLKRQGVPSEEIHKIAVAAAKRQRQNVLIRILKMILDFIKSMKK